MGIRLRLTNRIELLSDAMLDVETVRPLLALFEHDNPQHHKLKRMGFSTKGEPPVYRLWQKTFNPRDDDRVYSFPRGGLALITAWLDEHPTLEWEGVIVDETTLGDADLTGAIPEHRVELRPYQRTSVDKLIAAGSGILRAPTAAGKTCIAFALASELNLPTVIVCPNGAIFDLWIKRAETELGLKGDALGIIRASVCRIRPLTIAMQKTIAVQGSQAWRSAFGVVIIDEAQFAAARTYVEAIDPFTARHRFAVSADERRKDNREFLTHALFGNIAHEINREALVEAGHIMDVEIMVIPTEFRADWYSSDDAAEKKLRWNGEAMVPMSDAGGFGKLLEAISSDEERSQLAVDAAALEILEGGQMFVMATRREHCRMLDAMLAARGFKSGLMMGGTADRAEFLKSHAALSDGSYDAAIGTVQAIGTGVDMPNIAGVVVAAPIGNNRQLFNQVRGRAARKASDGKTKRLYYLWDRNVFPGHLKNLVKWNPTVRVKLGSDWLEPKEYFRRRPLPGTPKAALLARRA